MTNPLNTNKSNLIERLERIALMAEIANHHIDDMRVMPAAGVADVLLETIEALSVDQTPKGGL